MFQPALNKGVTRVAFGDVVRQVRDRVDPNESGLERFVAGEHMDNDELRIRRWGTIGDGYLGPAFHMRFKPGHVLYGSRRTYLRKVAVADFEGITANTTFVIESKDPKVLLPDLLPFIMQTESFHEHSKKQSKGSVNPYVNFSDLTWYEFALPPLDEQRRIADLLTAIEATRNAYIATSETLAVAGTALVADTVDGLAKSSSSVKLCDLAAVRYGLTVNPERRKSKMQVPYLRVANVMRGCFDLSEIKTVGTTEGDDVHRLVEGDVLIVEGHADAAQIGRAAVWAGEVPNMLHQNHLIRARCGQALAPQYLCLLINSPHGQTYFRSHAKSSSGLNTINSTVVKDYVFPAPTLEVQEALVERAATSARLEMDLSLRRDSLAQIRRVALESLDGTGS